MLESTQLPAWQRYSAHAAHGSLPEGRASGELTVSEQGFRFRSDRHEFFIPLKSASLTLGGASDRIVFISDPATPTLTLYTSDLRILEDDVLTAHPQLTQALRAIRARRTRNWSVLIAACCLVIASPIAFALNLDFFAGLAVRQVPHSWEEQLGKTALGQIQAQADFVAAEAVTPLLSELTTPLVSALHDTPYTFRFYIARDEAVNAFALPGGYIVIHSGLLLRAESAEELLGVIAHEIAHVTERHGTRSVVARAGAWFVFQALIGDAGGILGTMASAAPFLLSQRYSRGFEHDADEQGYGLLTRARVDAEGMASFFEKIREEELAMRQRAERLGATSEALAELPEFLRTHPLTEKRIEHLRQLAKAQQGPYVDLDRPFLQLKEQVAEFVRRDTAHAKDGHRQTASTP